MFDVIVVTDVHQHGWRVVDIFTGPDHGLDHRLWQLHAFTLGDCPDLLHCGYDDGVVAAEEGASARIQVGKGTCCVDAGVVDELSPSGEFHVFDILHVVVFVRVQRDEPLAGVDLGLFVHVVVDERAKGDYIFCNVFDGVLVQGCADEGDSRENNCLRILSVDGDFDPDTILDQHHRALLVVAVVQHVHHRCDVWNILCCDHNIVERSVFFHCFTGREHHVGGDISAHLTVVDRFDVVTLLRD